MVRSEFARDRQGNTTGKLAYVEVFRLYFLYNRGTALQASVLEGKSRVSML